MVEYDKAAAAEQAKIRTKELTDKLESGMKELYSSDKYKEYLKSVSHFHNYSSRNIMLIHQQNPNAKRVASFTLWRDKFNRGVKKGETGLYIYAPIGEKKPETKLFEKLDPDTKKPLLDADGNTIMEELTTLGSGPRFKLVPVFDISQTYGDPLPELVENLTGNVAHYEAFLDALKAVSPLPVEFESMNPDQDGYCRFGEKIGIREDMSEPQTVAAIVHEITHARLHDKNNKTAEDKPKNKYEKEIEAESVSYVVCQRFGIDTSPNSFGYLADYGSRDMNEIKASLEIIRKEAGSLINAIEDRFTAICKERGIDLAAKEPEKAAPEKTQEPEYTTETRTENIAGMDFEMQEVVPENSEKQPVGYLYFVSSDEKIPYYSASDIIETYKKELDYLSVQGVVYQDVADEALRRKLHDIYRGEFGEPPIYADSPERDEIHQFVVDYHAYITDTYRNGVPRDPQHIIEKDIAGLADIIRNGKTDTFREAIERAGNNSKTPDRAAALLKRLDSIAPQSEPEKPEYHIGSGPDKNGVSVWNWNETEDKDGQPKYLAHINFDREITYLDASLPDEVKAEIVDISQANWKEVYAIEMTGMDYDPPIPPWEREIMPDPSISIADRDAYGYTYEDMFPLNRDRALELFQDHTIFMLFNDGSESMVFSSLEIADHDGIFGIEREDWQKSDGYWDLAKATVPQQETLNKEKPSIPPAEPTPPEEQDNIPKNEVPIYRFSADTAIQNKELDAFQQSRKINIECGQALDQAVKDCNYETHRYDLKTAVKTVIEEYGADRVAWVLATNVHNAKNDGRLSSATKAWAKEFEIESEPDFFLNTHKTIIDGLVDRFREVSKEKPSLLADLEAKAQKSKQQFAQKPEPGKEAPKKKKDEVEV